MESISDLLGKRMPQEPDEIRRIKQYIDEQFHAPSNVALQGDNLVITVKSAALANMLRLRITQLQAASGTDKKLILRIGWAVSRALPEIADSSGSELTACRLARRLYRTLRGRRS